MGGSSQPDNRPGHEGEAAMTARVKVLIVVLALGACGHRSTTQPPPPIPGKGGQVSALVLDGAGFAIPGVSVLAVDSSTNERHQAFTDADGKFRLMASPSACIELTHAQLRTKRFCPYWVTPGTVIMEERETAFDEALPHDKSGQEFATMELTGEYTTGAEFSVFEPCKRHTSWWLDFSNDELASKVSAFRETSGECASQSRGQGVSCKVFLRVRGEVSRIDQFGHLNKYPRIIVVSDILEMSAAKDASCESLRNP